MCQVTIIEKKRTCYVICECGFEGAMLFAPAACPACGGLWAHPAFEQG